MRYVGILTHVAKDGKYGYINFRTVKKEEDSPSELQTKEDIFLHQDECPIPLMQNMEVAFDVEPDRRRANAFRAIEVSPITLPLANDGIELEVQGQENELRVAYSTVFVRWRFSTHVARLLKELNEEAVPIKLLLITRPKVENETWWEERTFVDVSEEMTTISFDRPGIHRLTAFLVYGRPSMSEKTLKDYFLQGRGDHSGVFRTNVLSSDSTAIIFNGYGDYHRLGSAVVDVDVPEDLFAPRPFDEKWVNFYITTPIIDSCQLNRRRWLFAYPIQPFLVLGHYAFLECISIVSIAILLSVGMRGISFRSILNPVAYMPNHVWHDLGNSIFLPRFNELRFWPGMALSPFFLSLCAVLGVLVTHKIDGDWFWNLHPINEWVPSLLLTMWDVWTVFGFWFLVIGGVLFVVALFFEPALDKITDLAESVNEKLGHASALKKQEEIDTRLLQEISAERPAFKPRTFHLRTIALKQKLCRKFART